MTMEGSGRGAVVQERWNLRERELTDDRIDVCCC
jgi:hypothetical protein